MKRVFIGGIFTVILLLLIPTSSAIQLNAIQENINSFSGEHVEYNQKDYEILEGIIHPLLYKILIPTLFLRMYISLVLTLISGEYIAGWHSAGYWEIDYPLLFLYSIRLFWKYYARLSFWDCISSTLHWNWDVL